MNPWNLHWKCSVATVTPWIRPNQYQSTLLNVCSCESLIPGYLIRFWNTRSITHSVPHCSTMKVLDKNLSARCSKDNPSQCKCSSRVAIGCKDDWSFWLLSYVAGTNRMR
jgi:hypothetical protein